MFYNLAGSLNSALVLISVYGIYLQLRTIWSRSNLQGYQKTELLSLNQFGVSYFAYFSFFVYGFSVQPFNHFMVWPRLIACILILLILLEMLKERKQRRVYQLVGAAGLSLLVGIVALLMGHAVVDTGRDISTLIILAVSICLAQGYGHQIKLIYNSGKTGAVNIQMNQSILLMDMSTFWLAYTMGFDKSWPMVILASVSATTKLIIMYLFRWVRSSDGAASKRLLTIQAD